jgi:hypothetical protein
MELIQIRDMDQKNIWMELNNMVLPNGIEKPLEFVRNIVSYLY